METAIFLENFLTIEQAAMRYRMSTSSLYKKAASRDIPSFRLGRRLLFDPAELDALFLKRCRREAIQPKREAKRAVK